MPEPLAPSRALVADDPFEQENLLERRWLKEWMID
jgi:hypothetical protein